MFTAAILVFIIYTPQCTFQYWFTFMERCKNEFILGVHIYTCIYIYIIIYNKIFAPIYFMYLNMRNRILYCHLI